MTTAAEILARFAEDPTSITSYDIGALRAALTGADEGTADAINAILHVDTPERYLAAVRNGRKAARPSYPILHQEQNR